MATKLTLLYSRPEAVTPRAARGPQVLAIDLGLQGGWAVLDRESGDLIRYGRTPLQSGIDGGPRSYDIGAMLSICRHTWSTAVLELPQARPGQAPQSSLKIGQGYGLWLAALVAGGASEIYGVHAQTWTAWAGITAQTAAWGKRRSMEIAHNLYPDSLILRATDDGISDAVLIGRYFVDNCPA